MWAATPMPRGANGCCKNCRRAFWRIAPQRALTRRGSATYVFCRDCGFVLRCPNCDNPLTQHLDQSREVLVCHHCGYNRQMPKTCPNCGSRQIRHYGTGTETVEAAVHELFPGARTLRWDRG